MEDRFRFRAWDRDQNDMIDVHEWAIESNGMKIGGYYNDLAYNFDLREIPRFVLMQCTGLKDKNGKPIYEGDILQHPIPWHTTSWGANRFKPHIVIWKQLESIEPSENMIGFDLPEDWQLTEVIGNVYENPELLDGGK